MATNSGQPGELHPYKFSIQQSINYLDHMSPNVKIRYQEKINILGTCDPYTTPADVFIALSWQCLYQTWSLEIFTLHHRGSVTLHRTKNESLQKYR